MAEKEEKDLDLDTDNAGKSKTNLLIIILIVVILAVGGGVAAMFLLGGDDDASEGNSSGDQAAAPVVKAPAIFSNMRPTFILNFEDTSKARYMQVDISVMSRSQASIDLALEHSPVIRNNIITIMGGHTFDQLNTKEGKAKLRKSILNSINETITSVVTNSTPPASDESGDGAGAVAAPGTSYIEAVYFTSFVMQ